MSLLEDIVAYTQNQTRNASEALGTAGKDTTSAVRQLIEQVLASQGGYTSSMERLVNINPVRGTSDDDLVFPNQPNAPASFLPEGSNSGALYKALMDEQMSMRGMRTPAQMRMPKSRGAYASDLDPVVQAHYDAIMQQIKQNAIPQVPYEQSVFNPESPEGMTVQSAQPVQSVQPVRLAGQSRIPFNQFTPEQQLQELQAVMRNSDVSIVDGVLTAKGRPVPTTEPVAKDQRTPDLNKVKAEMLRLEGIYQKEPWSEKVIQAKRSEAGAQMIQAGVDANLVYSWVDKGAAGLGDYEDRKAANAPRASIDLTLDERIELERAKTKFDAVREAFKSDKVPKPGWFSGNKDALKYVDRLETMIDRMMQSGTGGGVDNAGTFDTDMLRSIIQQRKAQRQGAQ